MQLNTAILCNTLQHTVAYCDTVHSNTQHCTATPCTTLQHTVIYCNTFTHTRPQGMIPKFSYQSLMRQKFATRHCNALQHPATPCNALQRTLHHTAAHSHHACTQGSTQNSRVGRGDSAQHDTATHCTTLLYSALPCTTLQHTATHTATHAATHRNTLQHTYIMHAPRGRHQNPPVAVGRSGSVQRQGPPKPGGISQSLPFFYQNVDEEYVCHFVQICVYIYLYICIYICV